MLVNVLISVKLSEVFREMLLFKSFKKYGASNYCIVTEFQSGGLNITARDVMGNIF